MATEMKRFTLSIPVDIENNAKAVKKDIFFDKSNSEMYRQLIRIGLEVMLKETKRTEMQ